MKFFHFKVRNVSLKNGSLLGSAAYILRANFTSEVKAKTFDYTARISDYKYDYLSHLHSYNSLEKIINKIEFEEKRLDAQVGKNFIISLPNELDDQTCYDTLISWMQEHFESKGHVCGFAIHEAEKTRSGKQNKHAHVFVCGRTIDSKGNIQKEKSKSEYILDKDGQKIPVMEFKNSKGKMETVPTKQWVINGVPRPDLLPPGATQKLYARNQKAWARETIHLNDFQKRSNVKTWRVDLATRLNERLKERGLNEIEHRSHYERNKTKELIFDCRKMQAEADALLEQIRLNEIKKKEEMARMNADLHRRAVEAERKRKLEEKERPAIEIKKSHSRGGRGGR